MRTVTFLLAITLTTAARAADGTPVGGSVMTPSWLGLLGNLALVISAVLAIGWLLRRQPSLRSGAATPIRVLAAHSLGARDRLLLVEIADQQLVLGQTSQGLSTLYVAKQPLLDTPSRDASPATFSERLRHALAGGEQ